MFVFPHSFIRTILACIFLIPAALFSQSDYEGDHEIWRREVNYDSCNNYDFCNGCEPTCNTTKWVVKEELLCLHPSIEQSYYVVDSDFNFENGNWYPYGNRLNNNPGFYAGTRLEILTDLFCDCYHDIDFRFAYFKAKHCDSVTGPYLYDVIGFPGDGAQYPEDSYYNGSARLRETFNYYASDLTVNKSSFGGCFDSLTLMLGLHYAFIQVSDDFRSAGNYQTTTGLVNINNHLSRRSNFWGVGPEFGFQYRYDFRNLCWFDPGLLSFDTSLRASLLASRTHADFHYGSTRTGSPGVTLHNQPVWRISPAVDFKFAFVYEQPCCWFIGTFEIGYEMLWYGNSVDNILGYDVAYAGLSTDMLSDLNLQGPYIALGFKF
jgi:hypothetical protein